MEIVRLAPGDEERVHAASHLFDGRARSGETIRTLREPTHHVLIAYEDGEPAGFVSGVEVSHPDKPTEMMLYELGVDEAHRRRGIGRALVRGLAGLAAERGCPSMFVLTERSNEAAIATYAFGDPVREDDLVMFTWKIPPRSRNPG
jgi:ribosomal protein S18 acetylase RimI-like enzyme